MRWLILLLLGGLAACSSQLSESDKAIVACEEWAKAGLRSPSTYSRASASEAKVSGRSMVTLSYDGANAYGTPVRESAICAFKMDGESVDTEGWYCGPPVSAETCEFSKQSQASTVRMEQLAQQLNGTPRKLCCDESFWAEMEAGAQGAAPKQRPGRR